MKEEEIEVAIKVVVVGNGAVGKSSMIQRYCKGIFTKDYKKTIGVDFLEKQIDVDCEDVRLMLWDTAGQEEFDAITKSYYRGAQACVLAFSTVDRSSFDAVPRWKDKVHQECGDVTMVLVQNKIDLVDESVVKPEEAESLAKKLKLRFYRTSVKENLNVQEVFEYLAQKYIERMNCVDETSENSDAQRQIGSGMESVISNSKPNAGGGKKKKETIQLKTKQQKQKKKKLCSSG